MIWIRDSNGWHDCFARKEEIHYIISIKLHRTDYERGEQIYKVLTGYRIQVPESVNITAETMREPLVATNLDDAKAQAEARIYTWLLEGVTI